MSTTTKKSTTPTTTVPKAAKAAKAAPATVEATPVAAVEEPVAAVAAPVTSDSENIFGSDNESPATPEKKARKPRASRKKISPEEKRLADLAAAISEMESLMARIRQLSVPLVEEPSESGSDDEPKAPRQVATHNVPEFVRSYVSKQGIRIFMDDECSEEINLDRPIDRNQFIRLIHAIIRHDQDTHEEARVFKLNDDGSYEVDKKGNRVVNGLIVRPSKVLMKGFFLPIWRDLIQPEIAKGSDSPIFDKIQNMTHPKPKKSKNSEEPATPAMPMINASGFLPEFPKNSFLIASLLVPRQERKATAPKGKKGTAAMDEVDEA